MQKNDNVKLILELCYKMVPVQCKMARIALNLGIRELAELAQVAPATISRFERGDELKPRTIEAIENALAQKGINFVRLDNGEVGVTLYDEK